MPTYRYVFADLVTDAYIDELDLDGVSFDRRICEPGSFSASIPVPNRAVAERVARIIPREESDLSAGPGRTVVHVLRNGALWGSYIIWRATPSGDDRGRVSIDIRGESLESWLHRREIRTGLVFTQEDQNEIARVLVDTAQHPIGQAGVPGTDIGITIAATGSSGTLRDRTYLASEAETYGRRLEELAEVLDGPEWMIRTGLGAGGERLRVFEVRDQIGDPSAVHRLSQPGDVTGWTWTIDAREAATSWQARGDTVNDDVAAGSEPLMSSWWYSVDHLAAGWPLTEATADHQSVTQPSTLEEYARWWTTRRAGALRVPQITVRLPESPTLTPEHLGDSVRITLVNDWWPVDGTGAPTFVHDWRVVGMRVTPATRGQGQDTAELIFEEPADRPAASSEPFDGFTRTETDTWGTSSSGHTWVEEGGAATDRAVDGSAGTLTMTSVTEPRLQALDVDLGDTEITTSVSSDQVASGDTISPGVLVRYESTSEHYRVHLWMQTDNSLELSLFVAGDGGTIGGTESAAGTYAAGTEVHMRVRTVGDQVLARAWTDDLSEPEDWQLDRTVPAGSRILSGDIGLFAELFGGSTNSDPVLSYHSLSLA